MTDWAEKLRQHANALTEAATFFRTFNGTDVEEHADALDDAAQAFKDDADEYEQFNAQ